MISIYDLKSYDAPWRMFIILGFFSLIFSGVDFAGAAFIFDRPSYYWYGVVFRSFVIVISVILSINIYYCYRYLGVMFWMISLPTIIWSSVIFFYTLNVWIFLVVIGLYFWVGWLFVVNSLSKQFDYFKAAKLLLKDYPKTVVKASNVLSASEKHTKNSKVSTGITAFILSYIPPWGVYAFPFIFVNILTPIFDLNGLAIMIASSELFLCIMLSGYFSFHWRYKEVFERAEELLAEKNLTSKE